MSALQVTQMHSPLDLLLSRLDGVRPEGRGHRAPCPACGGRSRKLSVAEGDDGRVLMHCFAGCTPAEVLAAIGLALGDLFPVRLRPQTPEEHRAHRRVMREIGWAAALEVIEVEAAVIQIAARQVDRWMPLSKEDSDRLRLAIKRIEGARAVLSAR